MHLTLQKTESYLFDAHVMSHRSSLMGLHLNSDDLLPCKLSETVQKYTLKNGKLIHEGTAKKYFSKFIEMHQLDPVRCFVIELEVDPFTLKSGRFQYLINLNAPFCDWDEALIVRRDIETTLYSIEQISDESDVLSITYFRRFAAFFPDFLIEHGIEGVFPVIAKKVL